MNVPIILQELIAGVVDNVDPPPGLAVVIDVTAEPLHAVRPPLEAVLRDLIAAAVKRHDPRFGHVGIKVFDEGPFCLFEVFHEAQEVAAVGLRERMAFSRRLVESYGGALEGDEFRARIRWPRST